MNPKILQQLMEHSDILVAMNVHVHIGFDDAEEEFRKTQAEVGRYAVNKMERPMVALQGDTVGFFLMEKQEKRERN